MSWTGEDHEDTLKKWQSSLGRGRLSKGSQDYQHLIFTAPQEAPTTTATTTATSALDRLASQRSSNQVAADDEASHLKHSAYRQKNARKRLGRLLVTCAKQHPQVAFNEDFEILASLILVVCKTERVAFTILEAISQDLDFDSIFSKQSYLTWVHAEDSDEETILQVFYELYPALATAIHRQGCHELLEQCVQSWLGSCFARVFNPEKQSLSDFLPLLDRIFMYDEDSKPHFCKIALALLISLAKQMEACAKGAALQDYFINLKEEGFVVSDGMLHLIDNASDTLSLDQGWTLALGLQRLCVELAPTYGSAATSCRYSGKLGNMLAKEHARQSCDAVVK
eukprot:TRINITY_DN9544_c0_g1_i7.p1 TRINITY_DN9544_c0_g1~~TRINITY_DN9544_c0_g1_i7.p1  ORF type:complete len:339 (+),score=59.25 TRINITY_DN9544_c0_g1_i7:96-1112(+)